MTRRHEDVWCRTKVVSSEPSCPLMLLEPQLHLILRRNIDMASQHDATEIEHAGPPLELVKSEYYIH